MHKKTWHLIGQLCLVCIIAAALLTVTAVLTDEKAEETGEIYRNFALRNIIGDGRVLSLEEVSDAHIQSAYTLESGDVIYELIDGTLFIELRILVRLNENGIFQEYRILNIDNQLQGWEFGNSFAYYELADIDSDTPRIRIWKYRIMKLIELAEEYHT